MLLNNELSSIALRRECTGEFVDGAAVKFNELVCIESDWCEAEVSLWLTVVGGGGGGAAFFLNVEVVDVELENMLDASDVSLFVYPLAEDDAILIGTGGADVVGSAGGAGGAGGAAEGSDGGIEEGGVGGIDI